MQFQNVVDFIRETFNKPDGFIPLHEPRFRGNEKKYLNECIDSTFVSSVGKFVDQFEHLVAEYTGAKYAVAAINGTAALHMALLLSGVKQVDEVITQPLTFIATANAISYIGAKPVFIDVDKNTMGLSPNALRTWLEVNVEMREVERVKKFEEVDKVEDIESSTFSKIKHFQPFNIITGNRIAACVPMHTYGHPCRIDKIVDICNQYNIPIVEDAAESLGSYFKGQHTGTFGKIGVLSFNGNKTITTGGGGMLLFNDVELAQKAKHLTTQAKIPHAWEFVHDEIGYNYRMPNINAALGLAQLEELEHFIDAQRKLAKKYSSFFNSLDISLFEEPENAKSNYWLNVVVLKDRKQRDEFLEYTNDKGVMTRPTWELMNNLTMFNNCQTGDLSNAEWLADRVVNIPSSVI